MTQSVLLASDPIPGDPNFAQQWYLAAAGSDRPSALDLNWLPAWRRYRGRGVTVGVVDAGIAADHPDLVANVDPSSAPPQSDTGRMATHGTNVAGIIAAAANDLGGVGVAPAATVVGRSLFGSGTLPQIEAIAAQAGVDVSNHSWGIDRPFADNFRQADWQALGTAIAQAAEQGRNGLGTVWVVAAGNAGTSGDNTNYHNLTNHRYAITVGALREDGGVTSYSAPGATVLVSALAGNPVAGSGSVFTTQAPAGYRSNFGGTSAAAPMVSGVVALMLEANPKLGDRDVQDILALTARQTGGTAAAWITNGAQTWNGGGLRHHPSYGFGLVDAAAAVRLAAAWTGGDRAPRTHRQAETVRVEGLGATIPDASSAGLRMTTEVNTPLVIDRVAVTIDWQGDRLDDLKLWLISPNGTRSLLLDRPPASMVVNGEDLGFTEQQLQFTLGSVGFLGEVATGTWTLWAVDQQSGQTHQLKAWQLELYGDRAAADAVASSPLTGDQAGNPKSDQDYVYTDAFATVSALDAKPAMRGANAPLPGDRHTLDDAGGRDRLNAAALSDLVQIDLMPGHTSWIAGEPVVTTPDTVIEDAIGGAGNDTVVGNHANNDLGGGEGDDTLLGRGGADQLAGGWGNDWLTGGQGSDTLRGDAGADTFALSERDGVLDPSQADRILDFEPGVDRLALLGEEGVGAIDWRFEAIALAVGPNHTVLSTAIRVGSDPQILAVALNRTPAEF
jgi:subtilisin-like proprotein convertase family protein